MARPFFNVSRYEDLDKFYDPEILDEAQERTNQRLQNYLTNMTEEKAMFHAKTPFLKELHPINGYPPSYIIARLARVNALMNPPTKEFLIQERICDIERTIGDPKAKLWKRVVAMENLRRAFATDDFREQLVSRVRKSELRTILIEAVKNRACRPLLEETCLTLMYIFYCMGTTSSRKTSTLLTRTIIHEMSHYLTEITDYCEQLKDAKVKFLDKKLILGDKAKDLRFWYPNFHVKRAGYSVHYASTSLLFYTLAFILFHTRHTPVAFEIAVNISLAFKPLRFYLLNILDMSFGYFQYADLILNPALPKHIYYTLSALCQGEEASKDEVTKAMVVSCCRKLYALCQNTPLHFRIRQIDGRQGRKVEKFKPGFSSTSSLSDRADTNEPAYSIGTTVETEFEKISDNGHYYDKPTT